MSSKNLNYNYTYVELLHEPYPKTKYLCELEISMQIQNNCTDAKNSLTNINKCLRS